MSSTPRRRRLEVEDTGKNGEITVVNFIDRKILDEQNIQKSAKTCSASWMNLGEKDLMNALCRVSFSAALEIHHAEQRCSPCPGPW